ncbi:uncharacterized protein LOC143912138 [Arctopsyche grandis]|uniref:uncharacterized protein LOC143912138 n=1 Tax=Arctopsyche grandis TaxID=121162 RepID=UPI00406D7E73
MDYEIGSIADLISGLHTPNRPRLQCRALTPEKRPPLDDDTPRSSPPKSARSRRPPILPSELTRLTRPVFKEEISTDVDSSNVKPIKPIQPAKPTGRKSKVKNNFQFLSQLSDFESDAETDARNNNEDFVKEYYEDKNGKREVYKKNKTSEIGSNTEVIPKRKDLKEESETTVLNGDKKSKKELKKLKKKQAKIDSKTLAESHISKEPTTEMDTVGSLDDSIVKSDSKKSKKGKRKSEEVIDSDKVAKKKKKSVEQNDETQTQSNDLKINSQDSIVQLENNVPNSFNDGPTDFQRAAQRRIESKLRKEQKHQDDKVNKTIFIGNIPVSILKKNYKKILRAKFSPYGSIESIRIRSVPVEDLKINPKVAFIEKKFHPERSTVTAYIKFTDPLSVDKALVENNTTIEENHIRVDSCAGDTKPQVDGRKTLFLGNLPFNIEEEKVRELFGNCGTILSVRLIRDKKTQVGKGFGFVNFEKSDGVEFALSMTEEDLKIDNKAIRLKRYNTHNPSKGDNNSNEVAGHRKNGKRELPNSNQRTSYQVPKSSKKRDAHGNKIRKRDTMPEKDKRKKKDAQSSADSQIFHSTNTTTSESNDQVVENKVAEKHKPHNDSFKGLVAEKKKKKKINKGVLRKKKISKILTHKSIPRT